MSLEWTELDNKAVTTAKLLAADAVENVGSGHPGTPISLAAVGYLLYQRFLRFDPTDPNWVGRDRFVLSAGHASLLQYIQLYLSGAGLELEDLKDFRFFGSRTPGHPEYGHTPGIEVTTGPLGSGLAAAVGMAMAARREHAILDPQAALGESPFDHRVYCIAGDGCLQEGITSEASSLAGTQELGNLVVIYDDNQISIEDDTSIAFTEDVLQRYRAYGWQTLEVDWRQEDGTYVEDVAALDTALRSALSETSQPTIIALRTIIGYPSPDKQNTGGIHGAKLGSESLVALKEVLGADPNVMFDVDEAVVAHTRQQVATRTGIEVAEWNADFADWAAANPEEYALYQRLAARELPAGWTDALPVIKPGKPMATRAASGQVLAALAPVLPELWGGSADLAGSNNTYLQGYPSFFPAKRSSKAFSGNIFGRNLHFGVREHAMGGIMNGIAADGLTRVYGATFFVFADYMRGSVRLAAIMDLPVIYVWTHDSVGVGEDGPTHQPVEHLLAYRAIPGLALVRPGDAAETVDAWRVILEQRHPVGLILSRQDLPNPARGAGTGLAEPQVARGGYVLADAVGKPDVLLLASGSEVQLALAARETLSADGIAARVVSMPCLEWFDAQDQEYRDSVLPPEVTARVSVEAGCALPWLPYLAGTGEAVSIETFGGVGTAAQLFEHFGITTEAVVSAARAQVQA